MCVYVFKFFKFVVTLLYNAHYQRAKLQLISDIRHFTAGNFTNPTEFSLHRVSVKEGHKLWISCCSSGQEIERTKTPGRGALAPTSRGWRPEAKLNLRRGMINLRRRTLNLRRGMIKLRRRFNFSDSPTRNLAEPPSWTRYPLTQPANHLLVKLCTK